MSPSAPHVTATAANGRNEKRRGEASPGRISISIMGFLTQPSPPYLPPPGHRKPLVRDYYGLTGGGPARLEGGAKRVAHNINFSWRALRRGCRGWERSGGIGAYQQALQIKSHSVVTMTLVHFSYSCWQQRNAEQDL